MGSLPLNWIFEYFKKGNSLLQLVVSVESKKRALHTIEISHQRATPFFPLVASLFLNNKKTSISVFFVLCAYFHLFGAVLEWGCYIVSIVHNVKHWLLLCSVHACLVGYSIVRLLGVCAPRQKGDLCQFSQCEPQWGHLELGGPPPKYQPFSC